MKKIAYIELDTHAELAANFYELTKDSSEFSVDFYFSEKIFNLLNIHKPNVFLTDYSQLLETLEKEKYDLIIIGTIHRHFIFYKAIVKKFNTAILVHNLNFTKAPKWELFKSIFKNDFKYRLKLFLKEGLLEAPKVYQKSKYLLGIDELVSQKNNLEFLPVYFNQFDSEKSDTETIRIVVPGAVSQSRRDYNSFLDKLKNFENTGINYEIIFLGKASGKELEKLKSIVDKLPQFIKIQFFEYKIPQQEFDNCMRKADVLYCPIQNETEFFSVKEIYGKTKISGNIGDAIKYAKPAIFPETYNSDLEFINKEKKDLQTQFSEVKNQRFDFQLYSLENVSKKLPILVERLTTKKT
ncbi:hypothetical protein [Epilithonimonas arachidiradicis]|uniref:Glycosyltransferase involved in cell wall biosynthesis n=1 Tax=Epilithonimonas arachidiradicis TaxID=1617282 RepID=A0A420CXD0_9FLAO|nr:hypothetical protein [Epilithonimonas arachidiradicis]RKE83121.1 hypothetical protein BXY58_2672 [Epilithonimonas arachidiradicis]GGG65121.1 hypothetical protein GCM10007332_29480 [Epilithonimonas arachidiradicis]